MVTHHAPSNRSEAPAYANSALHPAFCSDLDTLIESSGVPLWVHGHTHHNVDYQIGATRVISNQCGYPRKGGAGFDPGLVVEIADGTTRIISEAKGIEQPVASEPETGRLRDLPESERRAFQCHLYGKTCPVLLDARGWPLPDVLQDGFYWWDYVAWRDRRPTQQ